MPNFDFKCDEAIKAAEVISDYTSTEMSDMNNYENYIKKNVFTLPENIQLLELTPSLRKFNSASKTRRDKNHNITTGYQQLGSKLMEVKEYLELSKISRGFYDRLYKTLRTSEINKADIPDTIKEEDDIIRQLNKTMKSGALINNIIVIECNNT